MTLSFPPSTRLNKIMLPDIFRCCSGYRQRTEFVRTDSESLFPDSSGHIFNFCLALSWAEKTCLENGGFFLWKFCTLSVARTATENLRVLNFLENDEIVFHLAVMTQS